MQKYSHTLFLGIAGLPKRVKFILAIASILFIISTFALLARLDDRFLVEIPAQGGTLTEGIIGRPRFINPILAKSDTDRDLSILIYSGLLRATHNGTLIPDLAQNYTISPDGLTYTFTLKPNLVWHDGAPVTSGDIAFTIEKVQDNTLAIKSPRRASWDEVTVATPDDLTVIFTLKQAYAPFLENTTMGIIPKHIWQSVPNDEFDVSFYNIEPIGSGPYRMTEIVRDEKKGLPTSYALTAFDKFALGEPYITHLSMVFFGSQDELTQAYQDGSIEQMHTVDPALAETLEIQQSRIARAELPRVFAAFFNPQQNSILQDKAVREALTISIDKERIVREVLRGYGQTIDGPTPYQGETLAPTTQQDPSIRITNAGVILEDAGWKPNVSTGILERTDKKTKKTSTLTFSITVPDAPELTLAAKLLKENWEKLGAKVDVKVYELSTFGAEVLTPRSYDVLFYGMVVGRIPDPYPYWHSSQRNAPGLNIAEYASRPADKLMEEIRKTFDITQRTTLLEQFAEELHKDFPAAFIYAPEFLYATSANVRGMQFENITTESERFIDIHDWYIDSDHVWKFFADRAQRSRHQ